MLPVTIEKQIAIAAKATTVWRFIGTEEGLRQWWGLDIMLEAKPGGRCEERTHWQGRLCYLRGTVTTYNPPHELSLFLRNADEKAAWPAWATITLCLTEQSGQTHVTLVHQVFDAAVEAVTIGQVNPLPSVAALPHPMWNRRPPQNALALPPTFADQPTVAATLPYPTMTQSWLVQQAARWHARLHALARQAQLVEMEHAG